jgi:uncharacterized cupin superfamily protein
MHITNQSSVPVEHRLSPKGTYEIYRQHISLALGGIKDVGPWGGGHPFDVELAKIPPGKKGYPYHSHAAQTEYYLIVSGKGQVLDGAGKFTPIGSGDHIIFGPGEAHQLLNNSEEDLIFFVLADHHRAEITTYPHSGKRQVKPEYRYFRISDVDYYDGEE